MSDFIGHDYKRAEPEQMSALQYLTERAELVAARDSIARLEERVLAEATRRGEAFVLNMSYYHNEFNESFLTLEEAWERAQDDCYPHYIQCPGGLRIDHDQLIDGRVEEYLSLLAGGSTALRDGAL